jgi:two-component system OmpR family response regulator
MLPEMNGYDIVKAVREREIQTPILILSALQNLDDRLKGLREGGDDYLTKPFSLAELQIRAKKLWWRAKKQKSQIQLSFQDVDLNRLSRQVFRAGKELDLQKKEFNLLDLFMSNPNRIIPKSTILREIWGYEFDPQTNIVDVLVCRLREKIEPENSTRLIHTVRSAGYILKFTKSLH